MVKYKIIQDSVHGAIRIPDYLCDSIVDSLHFQRLRRIEQTSVRSLFPCARHDRFTHSLGVYYLGTLISRRICEETKRLKAIPKNQASILLSYEYACLLHDVGHAPFSHTFEDYYDKADPDKEGYLLQNKLIDIVKDEAFANDFTSQFEDSKPHERMSAIIALKNYKSIIEREVEYDLCEEKVHADATLIARMIVGCKYSDEDQHSFENVLIELIHGSVVDADGLDYVCRDSWTSGYTSSVNPSRLINYIKLFTNSCRHFKIAYSVKAINEVRALLSVKNFQIQNIFSHHIVAYESQLLIKGMESASLYQLKKDETDNQADRKQALETICDINTFFESLCFDKGYSLFLPTDDDFVAMMKCSIDNKYIHQWFSRDYLLQPIWKSREHFLVYFNKFDINVLDEFCWLYSEECRDYISSTINIEKSDIWVVDASPKNRLTALNKLYVEVGDEYIEYAKVFSEAGLQDSERLAKFKYIFIPRNDSAGKEIDMGGLREKLKIKFSLLK